MRGLPKTITAGGTAYAINCDIETAYNILEMFADPEMTEAAKIETMLYLLVVDYESLPPEHWQEAAEQAAWFLDGGKEYKSVKHMKPIIDWQQDESMIFAAVNKTAGMEVRNHLDEHWWTFLGWLDEVRESSLSTVMMLRRKINEGKKLEKWELEFVSRIPGLIKIREKLTEEQMEEDRRLEDLLRK